MKNCYDFFYFKIIIKIIEAQYMHHRFLKLYNSNGQINYFTNSIINLP